MGAAEVYPRDGDESMERDRRKGRTEDSGLFMMVKSIRRRKFIPWGSVLALLVTWLGLFLFSSKMYSGMLDLEEQSQGMFKFLIPHLQMVRRATLITAIVMSGLTVMMVLVGFCATLHCDHCYRGRFSGCLCGKLGGRIVCGLFWILSYLLNICWMFILSFMVVMTSAYFAFMPVCLPQSGSIDIYCLNFTVLSNMMTSSSNNNADAVNLILCGPPIDKLCKLTKAILPWYWGAYLGCIVVILGLSHFNGSLAANFAHGKHAVRYVKIRDRTSSTIRWTKDWKVKSVVYYDITTDSAISLRKRSIKLANGSLYSTDRPGDTKVNMRNGNSVQNGIYPAGKKVSRNTSYDSDWDEPEIPSRTSDWKSSNGSIVLSRKPLALPAPPPPPQPSLHCNGAVKSPPILPMYTSRSSSTQSETNLSAPPVAPKPRSRPQSALPSPGKRYREADL